MTVEEFLSKVAERHAKSKGGPDDVLGAACWFVSVQLARETLDSYSVKDFAGLICEGLPIAGPMRTEEDLQGWIENVEGIGGGSEEWIGLDEELDEHFGIRRGEEDK